MFWSSLSISLLGHEEFRSSRSESRSETGALSGHQYQSSNQYRESTRARQSSHFAVPSINPRGEFFHVFLSYRVADDEELVKSLHSKLQLDSKTHAIPLLEDSKFPHQFHKDLSNTADAAANIFLSARCLLDGEKWDWDSRGPWRWWRTTRSTTSRFTSSQPTGSLCCPRWLRR